ncbi:BTAD domain-containing putative transcriptional regulator [Streptomyces sp. TLI_171]|uniref:BTAD domain-containing putative transcriptional regulator n=1 Tax=Streptomyces sp. TLI_171 TaxID=1938859 RepID=UPI000C196467|nr:BTAD domain-containing putative transcriptional regulator [Streptomyces sp. TLI_171]RKE22483.1 transcriptional regulator [Streptomyces sp. TLI_171]
MVRITVLGALTAQVAGAATRLGGPRQRGVLAQLLVAHGAAVPADRLIDHLWDGRPPAKAAVSLQAYVSNLRRLLEPERGPRQAARLLVSEAGGYALRDVRTDAEEFEGLLAAAGGPGASEVLRRALALWRGDAYGEFADRAWAAAEIARLDGLRTAARELTVEWDLSEGRAGLAAQDAAGLVRAHPLREEGWRLLALALWHGGRQAEALAAVRRARAHLAAELGLDPGPALAAVESAILHQRVDELTVRRPEPATGPGAGTGAGLGAGAPVAAGRLAAGARAAAATSGRTAADGAAVQATADGRAAATRVVGAVEWAAGGAPAAETAVGPAAADASAAADPAGVAAAGGVTPGAPAVDARGMAAAAGVAVSPAAVGPAAAVAGAVSPAVPGGGARSAAIAGASGAAVADGPPAVPGGGARSAAVAGGAVADGLLLPVVPGGGARSAAPAGSVAVSPAAVDALGAGGGAVGALAVPGEVRSVRRQLFVGRQGELAALRRAAAEARGGVGFALVSGEAGAGKSTLLGRLREELAGAGWRVVTGRCPESAGAPAAWAWTEVLRELAWHEPATAGDGALAPLLADPDLMDRQDPVSGRFRLHRAVIAHLHAAARTAPLAVLLDDLHAADPETRELLAELAADPGPAGPDGGLLLVAAFRPGEGELAEVLARLARRAPTRVTLGGLAEPDAGRLIEAVCAAPVRPETVRALAERTGGNPFYLAESAQLLALEDESTALRQVPQGVREVLRRRFERLPAPAVDLLRLAAVAGREADVDLLLRAGEQDEDTATEAVEAAVAGGLLLEPRPGTVRFAHVLVRDTLYADLGGLRRARLHGRIGHALHDLRPGELTALAHHFTQAATTATAALAVDHCVRAAEAADRRYAHRSSVALLRQALDNLERAAEQPGEDRAARRIELLGALLRAQVRAGQVTDAGETKRRALRLARESGREDLLIAAWTAWTEPTPWVTHPYGTFDHEAVEQLTRLLRRTDLPPATRCRLLDALTYELDCSGDPEAVAAANEAVAIARAEGDPLLLCLALGAQARAYDHELAPVDRARLAAEIAELAAEHDLPAYRWHAEHLAATAAAVRGDLPALRRHLAAGEELADRYGLVELADVVLFQRAMLELAADRVEEAAELYERALTGLRARGSLHADGLGALVRIVIAHRQGRLAEVLPLIDQHRAEYGVLVSDVTALALLAAGHTPEEARQARVGRRVVHADYFRSLFLMMRADAVVALDERAEAVELLEEMRPLADLVAGASSTSVAARPVALSLGELARYLGRTEEAARFFRQAADVARRWESPRWEGEALAGLAALQLPKSAPSEAD